MVQMTTMRPGVREGLLGYSPQGLTRSWIQQRLMFLNCDIMSFTLELTYLSVRVAS